MKERLIVLTRIFTLLLLAAPILAVNIEFQAKAIPVVEHNNQVPPIANYNIVKTKIFPDMPGYTYTASQAPDHLIQAAKTSQKEPQKEESKVSSVKSTSSAQEQPQKPQENANTNDSDKGKKDQTKKVQDSTNGNAKNEVENQRKQVKQDEKQPSKDKETTKNPAPVEKENNNKVESTKNSQKPNTQQQGSKQKENISKQQHPFTSNPPVPTIVASKQKSEVVDTKTVSQISENKDKILFQINGNPIAIHDSLQYLPQIEEYSVVSSVIYPKSRFHIEQAAKSEYFLKKLKESSKELTDKEKMGKLLPTLMKDSAKFNEIMTKELQKQVEQSLAKKTKEDKTEVKQTSPADERSKLQALILNNERNKNHNQELRNEEEEKKLARIQKADSAKQPPPQQQQKKEIVDIAQQNSVLKKTEEQEERLRVKQLQENEESRIKEELKQKQLKRQIQESERIQREEQYIEKQKQFEKNLEKLKEQQKELKKSKSQLTNLKVAEEETKRKKSEQELIKIQEEQQKQKEQEARLDKLLREQKEADELIRKRNKGEQELHNNANEKEGRMIEGDYYFRKQPAENEPDQREANSKSSGSTQTDQLKNAEYYIQEQAKTNNILAELKVKQNQMQQNIDKKREEYERERAELGNIEHVLNEQKEEKKQSNLVIEQNKQKDVGKTQKLQISKPLIEKFESEDIKMAKPLIDNEQELKVATPPIDSLQTDDKVNPQTQTKSSTISKETEMITFNKKKLYFIICTILLGMCLITIIKRRSLPDSIPKSPDFQGGMLIPSEEFD